MNVFNQRLNSDKMKTNDMLEMGTYREREQREGEREREGHTERGGVEHTEREQREGERERERDIQR